MTDYIQDIANAMRSLFYPDDTCDFSQESDDYQEMTWYTTLPPFTFSNKYFITFRPIQFDFEIMEFEYDEEKDDFELHDYVINVPNQFHVLSADNFETFLEIIIPHAKEQKRLEDFEVLSSSHSCNHQMRHEMFDVSQDMLNSTMALEEV